MNQPDNKYLTIVSNLTAQREAINILEDVVRQMGCKINILEQQVCFLKSKVDPDEESDCDHEWTHSEIKGNEGRAPVKVCIDCYAVEFIQGKL